MPTEESDLTKLVDTYLLTNLVDAYLETGLWSESCNGTADHEDHVHTYADRPEDCDASLEYMNYGVDDVSDTARVEATADCEAFLTSIRDERPDVLAHLSLEDIGHNFWLTRNGHGTGFWDRGLPGDMGQWLTDLSRPYGTVSMYVHDGVVELAG